jgi:hypothetical protein
MSAHNKGMLQIFALIAFLLVFYLASALFTFDMSTPAYKYDEEIRDGKEVALGPHPRWWLCAPTHDGVAYEGHEWPFRLYMPLCRLWRLAKDYSAPVDDE